MSKSDVTIAPEAVFDLAGLAQLLRRHALWLFLAPLTSAGLVYAATFLLTPEFTARTSFLPPQQQQHAAASALASLGALTGLSTGSTKSSGDQYVALMQSQAIADRLIDAFALQKAYDSTYRTDARRTLAARSRIGIGRKDGIVTVEVDDPDPQRAANLANAYVAELRRLVSTLSVTEAQQRRVFFEQLLDQTRERLEQAQQALQASGFSTAALRAEPRSAADGYSRLRGEAAAAEVKVQALRTMLSDNAPEMRQALETLAALKSQLARSERAQEAPTGADYVSKYREYKYQEALFDAYSRQFELARVDESREGALIQVIDAAAEPEKPVRPRRLYLASIGAVCGLLVGLAWVVIRRTSR